MTCNSPIFQDDGVVGVIDAGGRVERTVIAEDLDIVCN